MINRFLVYPFIKHRSRLTQTLIELGIRPNAITTVGTLLQIGVGILFSRGYWTTGGLLLIFSSLFDTLDGEVARHSGQATRFGAFFDSTMDRISDLALFGGILAYHVRIGQSFLAFLALYCLMNAFLISYTKARAENLIENCTVGFAQRPERIVILIIAALVRAVPSGLAILAVLTTLTTLQRILHTYWTCEGQEDLHHGWHRILFLDFGRNSRLYRLMAFLIILFLVVKGLVL